MLMHRQVDRWSKWLERGKQEAGRHDGTLQSTPLPFATGATYHARGRPIPPSLNYGSILSIYALCTRWCLVLRPGARVPALLPRPMPTTVQSDGRRIASACGMDWRLEPRHVHPYTVYIQYIQTIRLEQESQWRALVNSMGGVTGSRSDRRWSPLRGKYKI